MTTDKISAKKLTSAFLIILAIVILDQLTKVWVTKADIAHACNMGFAFGIWQSFLNGAVAFLVLLAVIYAFSKEQHPIFYYSMAGIIGGGASNILDRLTRGCVVDFIDLKVWPAFNLADAAITVGVGILIFSLLKNIK